MMKRTANKIQGARLKALRVNAGLTQATLAKELGMLAGSWSSYENGRVSPNLDLIKKLSIIINKPEIEVLGFIIDEGEMHAHKMRPHPIFKKRARITRLAHKINAVTMKQYFLMQELQKQLRKGIK